MVFDHVGVIGLDISLDEGPVGYWVKVFGIYVGG